MPRRSNGEGMIRKRTDGRWEGRIVVGYRADGRAITRSAYGATQKEMLIKFRQLQEMYRDVRLCDESSMPLSRWLDIWLDHVKDSIRESTYRNYHEICVNYIVPRLGATPLIKITRSDVQTLYATLRAEGRTKTSEEKGLQLSGSTVFSVHCMLHLALDAAFQSRIIPSNPTEGVVVPKKDPPPMQVLNDEQIDCFLEAIKKDRIWHDLFYTEITTGLREGEICGLMWDDLDMNKGVLAIQRTITVTGRDHQVHIQEPKTEAGKRQIQLPPSTCDLLKQRRLDSRSKWIFPYMFDNEKPVPPSYVYRRLKEILLEEGLPSIRFHDLRHTFATRALSSGVDAKTLSGILGHTNASFTLDTYTHVTTDMQRSAALIVDRFLIDLLGADYSNGET